MNALIYAINEVKNKIPYELLYDGMTFDEPPSSVNLSTLDDKILRKVIKKRVMTDANIVGGTEIIVPLINVSPSYYEDYYTVYNIPNEMVMNREIISVLNITHLPMNSFYNQAAGSMATPGTGVGGNWYGTYPGVNGGSFLNVGDRIGSSVAPVGILTNANIELIAYNTILVYAHYRTLASFGVRLIIENDSNMNNIQPRSYKSFGMLCSLAVKAYLYNKLIIAINSGYLSGGQELGIFKSILEEYNTAEEDYGTYLNEVWGKVSYMNDTPRHNKFLQSMFAPDI